MNFSRKNTITLLKVCAFLIFIGRGYQFLFFDAPFRALLWDHGLMAGIVEGWFNTPWQDYVTNLTVDSWIQRSIRINGALYVLAGIAALAINNKNKKWLKLPIIIGAVLLTVLSVLLMKAKFFHYAQFFEHAIQFATPLVLLMALNERISLQKITFTLKVLIAITFTSHGLYALGYYQVPGNFIDMTIASLGISENTTVTFLYIAGVLDLVLSVAIFIPKIARYALLYAFIWGIMTALARVVAGTYIDFFADSLHQSLHLTIYRIPHGLVPLLAFLLYQRQFKTHATPQKNHTNPALT
ncbi:hypothetical protein [Marixanthomonas spongiae]|uniref:Uncharacterized protein n=1 Tax=Marixanthomonas spongiae TaxID=2174845 RepID=A0A2U0HZR9_9FLAO|nr:hypothetical protein [Marixanthomonas spongiae]PVW14328.1 hypothetical protein DDV96_11050 [Marixanthomonas spongiae]